MPGSTSVSVATTAVPPTGTASATTSGGATTTPTTAPTTAASTTSPPQSTFATVTSDVVGTAVGGNSGGEGVGQTNTFSETIRNPDGTCSGWDGPGGAWTQGLESGAAVVFLDADTDVQIGTGQLGTSSWSDVDPSGNEQWNCTFPFSGTVDGTPSRFRMKVADLAPWTLRADPTAPGAFVASVNTVVQVDVFGECSDPPQFTEVGQWSAVGEYWSNGIPSLCNSGLAVVDVERPCRPEGVGSDYIVAVTSAADGTVIEDRGGLHVQPAELAPLTPVVVHVATGRPC